jgi:hypothetical protein
MREDNESTRRETGVAFALASFLLNLLILLALCGSVWMLHSTVTQSNSFSLFVRDHTNYK